MLYLITGKPGDGKTQYVIKTVMDRAAAESRPVFYKRIDELTLDWEQIEDPKHWNDCPDGSIVILDECQNDFRVRTMSASVPSHVAELETHRHRGIDIYAITQNPALIDNNVRKLAGEHIHIHNPFKTNSATVLRFSEVQSDPLRARNDALTKGSFRYDKEIWKLYKSATVHTHKRRIPPKVYFILALLVVLLGIAFFTYNKLFVDGLAADVPIKDATASTDMVSDFERSVNPAPSNNRPKTRAEYLAGYVPRMKGRLETSPIYDDVMTVKSYPRVQCLFSKTKGCTCYTQQATQIRIPDQQCLFHVQDGGYFNNALPDYALKDHEDNMNEEDHYRNLAYLAEIEDDDIEGKETLVIGESKRTRLRYSDPRKRGSVKVNKVGK